VAVDVSVMTTGPLEVKFLKAAPTTGDEQRRSLVIEQALALSPLRDEEPVGWQFDGTRPVTRPRPQPVLN